MEAIVAVYSDWGIGAGGTQPVTVPADRKRFAEITRGAAIIVGRRTLSDFPGGRPLKGRANIVLTRKDISIERATVVHSVEEALDVAFDYDKVFVAGGESVYRAFFTHLNRIYVTKLDVCPHSDVFFENLDSSLAWHRAERSETFEHEGIKYSFCVYERLFEDD